MLKEQFISRTADRKFLEHQNRIRGLVSELKSRRFVDEQGFKVFQKVRSQLKERLLDARGELDPTQFEEFNSWVSEHNNAQLSEVVRGRAGYDELAGIYLRAPVVSLENEIRWVASRLRTEIRRINAFRRAVLEIEKAVLKGEFSDAISVLTAVEEAFGITMWSVQMHIAIEQSANGLEEQKRYTSEVRGVYKQGLLNFTAYHTSVRNEDRTTFSKFVDDVGERISNHRYYKKPTQAYMKYRLLDQMPLTDSGLADVLRIEQSHSIIDLYETFVCVVQEIVRRKTAEEALAVLGESISSLSDVKDFRLTKAEFIIAPETAPSDLPVRDNSVSDPLFAGTIVKSLRLARLKVSEDLGGDPWQLIYAGFAFAHLSRQHVRTNLGSIYIASLLAKVFRRSSSADEAWANLSKLALNYKGLPVFSGIADLLRQIKRGSPDQAWQPWLIGLNSPKVGIEDYPNREGDALPEAKLADCLPTTRAWAAMHQPDASIPETGVVTLLMRSVGYLQRGLPGEAVDVLGQNSLNSLREPMRATKSALLLHALAATGRRSEVIELIGDEGARSDAHAFFLPVEATLKHYAIVDYRQVQQTLTAPIALHHLWSIAESPQTASLMRFMTSSTWRGLGTVRPSELIESKQTYPAHQLVYFLANVCVPDVLDVSRLFKSSNEVLNERQAICASLCELDKENSGSYEDEVLSISNQLALEEGKRIVDRSRIHVDTNAFYRWGARELAEDYARYCDLVDIDGVEGQNFDDVLKELLSNPTQPTPFVPDNEADAVFVSLLHRLSEEFLTNTNFGLDFYLSKRVRHQSFVGLIRGPLEFAHLITTRQSEGGKYHRNDHWIDKFETLSDSERTKFHQALTECAMKFDDTLIEAKDSKFHLRTPEAPQGLLYLELSSQLIVLFKAIVKSDVDFYDFIATATVFFWGALEQRLAEVRTLISHDMKARIIEGFDELRATVRRIAEQDPEFLEFDTQVGQCSTEVQIALDTAAGWFTHIDQEAQKRQFTLDEVLNVAIDSSLKCLRGFSPNISTDVSGDLYIFASDLVFFHDVIFVALGNARKHSEIKSPSIDISVVWNEVEETLEITVKNDGRPSNRAGKEKRLSSIRERIELGQMSGLTRKEEGSGFFKIAAIVTQSRKGKIEFGFTDENLFQLRVVFSVINQMVEI